MLNLRRVFKNYDETGSFNEQINLYGFVDDHLFLTKTGDLGAVLEVRGVDFECLDGTTVDALTKRLESALKLFDEKIRVYQYLFKTNNQAIPHKLYGNAVIDAAITNRIEHLASKADKLFSLAIYYVVLFEGFRYERNLGAVLLETSNHQLKCLRDLTPGLRPQNQAFLFKKRSARAGPVLLRKVKAFILQ